MRLYGVLYIGLAMILGACKAPYFNTANNMRLINGTVYKTDGSEVDGQITLNIENYRPSRLYVTIVPQNAKEGQKINLTDIKGMNIRGDYYEPKLIDMGGLGNDDQLRFVKRLTKEGSRLHLYELMQERTRERYNRYGGSTSYNETQYSYYLITPGHTRQMPAWNIEGRRLTPNFEDKMSEIVKDCPALADKIKRKEKGYFYAQVSLIDSRRIETIMTIIDEYNKCKQ